MKRVLILSHANCLDGYVAAGIACKRYLAEGWAVELRFGRYDVEADMSMLTKELEDTLFNELVIVDYSVAIERLLEVSHLTDIVRIYDHHKGFKESLDQYLESLIINKDTYTTGIKVATSTCVENIHIHYDSNECGASLVYKNSLTGRNILPTPVPYLLQYVRDYDLWKLKISGIKGIHDSLYASINTAYLNDKSPRVLADKVNSIKNNLEGHYCRDLLSQNARAIISYKESQIASAIEYLKVVMVEGLGRVALTTAPRELRNDLADEILNRLGLADVCINYSVNLSKNKCFCSIRSSYRGDASIDVAKIANKFGGNGHTTSAGFSCSIEKFKALFLGIDYGD